MLKPRTLAIAGSIAALSFAAAPIAQAASSHQSDRSRDAIGVRHVEKASVDKTSVDKASFDKASVDKSWDIRDY
jgi:hypothetical protein